MTDTSGTSLADYQQAIDDAVACLLIETGIPQHIWDGWTESAEAWRRWLEQRNASILTSARARFVRLMEEQQP